MSVRNIPPLRVAGVSRSLIGLSTGNDADRDALLSEEKRRLMASERRFKERRRRAKEDAEWSTLYRLTCLLVALVVGFSPLLMVAAYFLLVEQDQQDGKCSYAPSVNRSTAKLLYRGGDFLALLTSADEGPRAEYRRMVRASLSNKLAYATRHHYFRKLAESPTITFIEEPLATTKRVLIRCATQATRYLRCASCAHQ